MKRLFEIDTYISNPLRFISLMLSLMASFTSCAPTEDRATSRNSSQFYRIGYPEITANAVGFINENEKSSLSVFVQVALQSIIVKQETEGKKADVLLEISIDHVEGDISNRFTKAYTIDLNESLIKNLNSFDFSQQFEVKPGFYRVLIQLTDQQSMKTATIGMETTVPDISNATPELSSLMFLVKENEDSNYTPYLTYSIPKHYDSLKIYSQIVTASKPIKSIHLQISKILSDSLPARRIHEPDVLPGQLPYSGIDYSKTKIVYENAEQTDFDKISRIYEIMDQIPLPETGNYVAQLDVILEDTISLNRKWYFSIKPSYYPKIRTARELAEPLAYLIDDKEYRNMMRINNPDSLKKVIDSFWVKLIGNKKIAIQSLQLYYERVEQANRQFTTFKEGWKTDAGMILILFGAPRVVDQVFRDVIWAYGMYQNQNYYDPTTTFIFQRIQNTNESYPFEHYLLRRDPGYFQTYQQILGDWKSGVNLTD